MPAGNDPNEDDMELNPQQQMAVDHLYGPCLVTAVPGSGKTRTLTERAVNLIHNHGVPPESILCLTFTNKAAREMQARIAASVETRAMPVIGTFHRLCLGILKHYGSRIGLEKFTILDDSARATLLNQVTAELGMEKLDWYGRNRINRILDDLREQLLTLEAVQPHLRERDEPIIVRYLETLDKRRVVDFSGLLHKAYMLLTGYEDIRQMVQSRFRFIQVDESQDTNEIQYQLVWIIGNHRNVFFVGDIAQAIYGFRGARPENLIRLKNRTEDLTEITLPYNYRSTPAILGPAEALIRRNKETSDTKLIPANESLGVGEPVRAIERQNPEEEAKAVVDRILRRKKLEPHTQWKDFAVLYRLNRQSPAIETELRSRGVPCKVVGGLSFFDRSEVKDALAYLNLIANPHDFGSFERIAAKPARGLGGKTLCLIAAAMSNQGTDLFETCERASELIDLTERKRQALEEFAAAAKPYRKMAPGSLSESTSKLLEDTGYIYFLQQQAAKSQEEAERLEGLEEFLSIMEAYANRVPNGTLSDFLFELSLMSSEDTDSSDEDKVALMTLHSAKGLEWPHVTIVGVEQGILPFDKAIQEGQITEERRLFYVGMTRAQRSLTLTCCRHRSERNFSSGLSSAFASCPSEFLIEAGLEVQGEQ